MRYILDSSGYVESVSCTPFNCKDKSCTEYKGSIPSGYDSLEDWATTANIRAYKITSGNLVYDSARDAALQAEWAKTGRIEDYSLDEQIIGTWIDGKPLYRKTFKLTSPSQTSSSETILTLDGNCSIVKYEGILESAGNSKYPLNVWFSSSDYIYSYILPDGLKLKVGHTSYASRPIIVTVEYTKN